jgi:plasmid stabilization system protein ParE
VTARYRLLAAAETDLRAIIRYTRSKWDDGQARRYAAHLKHGIEAIVAGDVQIRDMAALHPGLRMAKCHHHYIFCLFGPDAPVLVLAILHERMDLMERLADRLKG